MTVSRFLELSILPERLAISRLPPGHPWPDWLSQESFFSVARTTDELSIVCDESRIPSTIESRGGWRALKVRGPLDFDEAGILASLAQPLAAAGVSTFAISTFDTDYLLVEQPNLARSVALLTAAGHKLLEES